MIHPLQCDNCSTVTDFTLSFDAYDRFVEGELRLECPACGSSHLTKVICVTPHVEVRLAYSEVKKLGHLASRNLSRMSSDEAAERAIKDKVAARGPEGCDL